MNNFARKFGCVLLFVLICFCGDTFSQRRKRVSPPKPPRSAYIPLSTDNLPADKKLRVETFEKVWRTIFYYYFDGKFNNINWAALKFEYEPKVRAAKTDDELHDLLDAMLSRLKVSHLGIIRPAVYEAIETAKKTARTRAAERERVLKSNDATGQQETDETLDVEEPLAVYGPGIDLRIIDDRFVVFRVGTNTAAETSGIKPGYVIESIDDVSLSLLFSHVKTLEKDDPRILRHLPIEVVGEMLNGEQGSTVKIGYLDANDKKGDVVIRRELLPTFSVTMGPDYPEQQLTFQTKSLDENTGYIFFDNFSLPVIEKFCDAITQFKSKSSLVIDLRGNTGGVIGISVALTGMLSDRPVDLGTAIFRYGEEPMIASSKPKHFKGRIVILTDELSVSAAEMFAASLQAAGRAKVIGSRSAGESLPSVVVDLPTGARLLYPVANLRTAAGRYIEGQGVLPDKSVMLDRAWLLKNQDPQLNAALAELRIPEKAITPVSVAPNAAVGVPPPPPAKPVPKTLATVTVQIPPAPREPPDTIEPKAAEFITQFERLSGGAAAYAAISSYELTGSVDSVSMGARNSQEYRSYRDGNERQLLILKSPVTGEMRNFRDGKSVRVTTDLGIEIDRPLPMPVAENDFLYSITRSMKVENYSKLLYLGVFDRGERKVHLIDGKTKDGLTVAIYFDSETKLLAGFEGPTGGLSFGDYRKVGNLMFPFNISSQDYLNIQLTDVKLNTKIDPVVFDKKVNCYDKPVS